LYHLFGAIYRTNRTMKGFTSVVLGLLVAFVVAINSERRHYHGYKVIRTRPTTENDLDSLKALENEGVDFWMRPRNIGGYADIMVSPDSYSTINSILENQQMDSKVMIQDVEQLIENERTRLSTRQDKEMNWEEYQTLPTIYEWLDNLIASNSELISSESYGLSTEGRELKVYKVSTGGSGKPAFWIDATIHAREWIATSTATYIINQLVTKGEDYADILNSVDFYFVPLVNPDGYEFSHETDRLWRKTRSNYGNYTGDCIGIDPNRNFGFHYGEDDGSSNNPCSLTYRGPNAYSEPEADALKNYILSTANETNWTAFITLHSYSQLWMTPYGYSATILPPDYTEMMEVANKALNALTAVNGTEYLAGSAAQILYPSSGSSRDWAKGEGGFKYVYTIELRDQGRYGFVLPPEFILPTAVETWAGIQVVARSLISSEKSTQ